MRLGLFEILPHFMEEEEEEVEAARSHVRIAGGRTWLSWIF